MNKTLIFRKIGGIISELTEQYQYLAESPENINPLELELFIANSHFLAEHLAILKKLESSPELLSQNNSVSPVSIPDSITNIPSVETIALPVQEEPINSGVEAAEMHHHPEKKEEPEWFKPIEHENFAGEEEEQHESEKTDEQAILIPEVPPSDAQETKDLPAESAEIVATPIRETVAIKLTDASSTESAEKVPTLNEILSAGKNQANIATAISQHEEKDLKSMIKLNDKLMFVRDLFGGYSLAYSEAIELHKRFDTFEAAENFLKQNYAVKNKWSEKQGTVDQFYEILNRRFS